MAMHLHVEAIHCNDQLQSILAGRAGLKNLQGQFSSYRLHCIAALSNN